MSEMRLEPVQGSRLWTAADFERDPSVTHLSAGQIAEIDRALRSVQAKGLSWGDFARDDFPLRQVAELIDRTREELISGRGYSLMCGLPVADYSQEELEIIYYGLGLHMGVIVSQNGRGDVLTHVTDHGFAPGNPNVRGYQDRRSQPPHADPTDVVALLCIRKAQEGGISSIVNVAAMYNAMLAECPEHLAVLYRGFHMDMRGEGTAQDDTNGTTRDRIPIFSYHRGTLSSWFARRVFEGAAAKRNEPLSDAEVAALDAFEALSNRPEFIARMDLAPGDVQWVNNYAVLHARTGYEDFPEPERKRLMVRLWLNLPEQELASDFAQLIRRGIPRSESGKLGAEIAATAAH